MTHDATGLGEVTNHSSLRGITIKTFEPTRYDTLYKEDQTSLFSNCSESIKKIMNYLFPQPSLNIGELLNKYNHYRKSIGVSDKTIFGDLAKIRIVLSLCKHNNLNKIKALDAEEIKLLLSCYPSNAHKKKAFKNLNAIQIIETNKSLQHPFLSQSTVLNYLQKVSSFLNWAMRMEFIKTNSFRGLRVNTRGNNKAAKRHALTDNHLCLLFQMQEYQTGRAKYSYHYWLLLILRYTGMRLNEVCQLYRNDILEIDGIFCFRISDEFEGQKVKNDNAYRYVPIATSLIELGILNFINTKKELIFPELPLGLDGYSSNASKWACHRRKKLGFTRGYDLHSFRHRFITELKNREISESLVAAICGHEHDGITYKIYGKEYNPARLLEIIDMIDTQFTQKIAIYQA